MRRARIRLQIAKAISDILPMGHTLSIANVRRYVGRGVLREYNIRSDTPIHQKDWSIAITIARELRRNEKSTTERDRELLLKRNLADVMREHYRKYPPASTGTRD